MEYSVIKYMFTPVLRLRFGCAHFTMECCFTGVFSLQVALQLTHRTTTLPHIKRIKMVI